MQKPLQSVERLQEAALEHHRWKRQMATHLMLQVKRQMIALNRSRNSVCGVCVYCAVVLLCNFLCGRLHVKLDGVTIYGHLYSMIGIKQQHHLERYGLHPPYTHRTRTVVFQHHSASMDHFTWTTIWSLCFGRNLNVKHNTASQEWLLLIVNNCSQ